MQSSEHQAERLGGSVGVTCGSAIIKILFCTLKWKNGSGKLPFPFLFECTEMLAQYSFLLEDNIPPECQQSTSDIYTVCTLPATSCRLGYSKSRVSQGYFLNSQYDLKDWKQKRLPDYFLTW